MAADRAIVYLLAGLLLASALAVPGLLAYRRTLSNGRREETDINAMRAQLAWAYERIGVLEHQVSELQTQTQSVPAMQAQIKQLTEDNLKLYRQVESLRSRLQDAEIENNALRARMEPK